MPVINRRLQFSGIIVAIGLSYVMSQFYRTSNGVIVKALAQEFGLSPIALGILTGVFFISFALAQVPLGMLFDRYGARCTLPIILIAAVVGALIFATADGFLGLLVGRLMMGLGVSCVLVGAMFLFGRWVSADRYATWLGRMIALGGIGVLLSTSPLGVVTETIGWRYAFYCAGAITALGAVLIYLLVRDTPPDYNKKLNPPEGFKGSVGGVIEVCKTKHLPTVMIMAFASYPVLTSILGLWGAAYMADVYNYNTVQSGNVLLLMAIGLIVGHIVFGPLERILDSRKWLVFGAATTVLICFVILSMVPHLSEKIVIMLLVIISFFSAYNIVIAGHGRALFPDRLAGRGMAMLAIALMGGPAIVQFLTGFIMDAFPSENGIAPVEAYRAVFGCLAGIILISVIAYLRIPDARPSKGFIRDQKV